MTTGIDSAEERISALKAKISDLADSLDARRARRAGALGGAVFLLLLTLGGLHDLLTDKAGIWRAVGISPDAVRWFTIASGLIGLALLATAVQLKPSASGAAESQLEDLERELADILAKRLS